MPETVPHGIGLPPMSSPSAVSEAVVRRRAVAGLAAPSGYLQWTWAAVGAVAVLDVIWCAYADMRIYGAGKLALTVACLLALSAIYRRRSRGLADSAQIAALWIAFTACCCVLSYLCATSMQPL